MMERIMNVAEFSEYVRDGVRAGLPADLAGAEINIVYGKSDDPQLEIQCPWNTTVRYMLASDYKAYLSGTHTPEFSVANILNNRNLYHVPIDIRQNDNISAKDMIKRNVPFPYGRTRKPKKVGIFFKIIKLFVWFLV